MATEYEHNAADIVIEDASSVVTRAARDGRRVLLRRSSKASPTSRELAMLRHGASISQSLDLPGVLRVHAVEELAGGVVVVMEDFGGVPLRTVLSQRRIEVLEALRIAQELAKILGALRRARVVHHNVEPANIYVDTASGEVKLASFDIASRLDSGRPVLTGAGLLEGTLAYLSPEQTGRMNRSVDYRTDLYSLGVTLFEMLAGRVPFDAADPTALVHCHLAVAPEPPHRIRPTVDVAVSAVVMKLLAKNAEDRYQTAQGLIADLEECSYQLETAGTIGDFTPGARDSASDFRIPEKLYGREKEREGLFSLFERAASGVAEIGLISGASGVGKSTLVNELQRPILERRGYFTSGKFDPRGRAPHGAIIQAFQGLIRELLSEGEKKIASLRKRLHEALGASAQVVIDLIPEVALLVGPQPPVPAVGPSEAHHRFNHVFQRFIGVFARREHPLAIFLDDLQWADGASLGLIHHLLSDPGPRHLLIVGARCDDAASDAHPPSLAPAVEIRLAPLDPADVRRMIGDTLGCPDDEAARELARFVHERAEGNPFLVKQLLTSLHAKELLTFSADAARWVWSLPRIQEESLADVMAARLQALPEASRRVVHLAACLGASFDLQTLAVVDRSTFRDTAATLREAVEAGLLFPIGDEHRYLDTESSRASSPDGSGRRVRYEFLHDRAREAAYALIEADRRPELHLRIGRLLLASIPEEERSERIFEIVNQLDANADLVDDVGERHLLARLHLLAARRAKLSTAYEFALRILAVATSLLGPASWHEEHELTLSIHLLRAECEHLLGHFDAAMAGLGVALAGASTPEEKAGIHALEILTHVARADDDGVRRASSAALALYGVEVPPPEQLGPAEDAARVRLAASLAGRSIPDLAHLAEATDPAARARAALLAQALIHGVYPDPRLSSLLAMILVNESLEHGVSPGSSMGYVRYAVSLGALTADHVVAHALGEVALSLAERLDDVILRARVDLWFSAFVNPWRRPLRTSYPFLERACTALFESGSLRRAGVAAAQSILLALLGGDELQALEERTRRYHDAQVRLGHRENAELLACFLRMTTLLIQGAIPPDQEPDLGAEGLSARTADLPAARFTHELLDLIVAFIFGDLERALALATSGASHAHFAAGHIAEAELRFFRALVIAALLPTSTPEERRERLSLFVEDQKMVALWAESCPESFGYKHHLVCAEEARVLGDNEAAMALYDQAIEGAAEQEITHHQAIAGELAAKFYLDRGRTRIARAYLTDARQAYLRWGATAKVAALDLQYPGLLQGMGVEARSGIESPGSGAVDLLAVLTASQAISGEIVLDELLRKLMSTLIDCAGAQRGLLLLEGDHEIIVEAGGAEPILVTDDTVDDRADVSRAIVRYVQRTRESIVLGDAANAGQFRSDPYVATARPKSILCMPILARQKLVGVLYLENNLVTSAFTPERCRALDLLAAQAAISLENARLHDTLESRVKVRTQELGSSNEELSLTLRRLKETQKQLITQEKLASLGALTSGIAHEIKNPLNFINNFAELSVSLAGDLRQEIEDQRSRLEPDSVAIIDEILADLQQNAAKINEHGRRADDIVRAMLEHARSGAGERREVDVNALLGEYTNLAYQGFRSQDPGFNVTIETAHDLTVGKILIPSQEIGRVFLNLINNACYAARAQRQRQGERFSPTIRVATRSLGDRVEIRVRDNGPGIPPSVREKIFNPFFTTKPPGEGTGLGLSISHEIIEGNGGTLEFETVEGMFTEFIITLPRRGR
jgi:predicted ATPase/signal transduction histidine kinase